MPIIHAWDLQEERLVFGREAEFSDEARFRTDVSVVGWTPDSVKGDFSLNGDNVVFDQAKQDARLGEMFTRLRGEALAKVDARTTAKIASETFTHAGLEFSVSLSAQVKWNGLYNARASITYPQLVFNKDDTQTHSIADSAEVETMYGLAVTKVKALVDEGTTVKQNVLAAADIDAVNVLVNQYIED